MARDQKTDQKLPAADVQDLDAPIETAPPATQFVQSGAIPPVETAAAKPAPSASDRAFGKGVQALEAMLAKGTPKASDVATLIDAHRDEHDQMLSLVQQKLGDVFAASVRADLSSLRASIANKEVVAGDPGDPNADYLDISQAQGGAKWKAAGGNFTGTADKNGLDTTVKAGAHDSIHAKVKPDKSGTLDWNHDGKTEAEVAGSYKDGKNYDASLSRTQDVGGASVTEGVKHAVADGKTSDSAYADVKKGDTTAHADVGLADGKPAEHLSASTKTAHDTISGSVGHDAKGTSAEIKDTHDFGGGKTGSLDVKRDGAGALSETGTFKTKTDDISETVSHDKKGTAAEIKDTHDFGGGTTGSLDLKRDAAGALSETGTLAHKGAHDQETATVAHDNKGTTGSLTGSYDAGNTKLDGSVARTADAWKLHGGATEKVNPALTLSGKVDETLPDKGKNQTDVSLSEKYSSGKVIQGLEVDGGKGAHDYLKATGSVDAQLAPNLYGSAWGSYSYEAGHQDTAQIGASLTLTHDEKEALTLAGVVDQHGRFETRLQLDVFKDRINSISALDQHKKDAVVSLFLSYSQQVGGHRALDDRFGAPQLETPNNASQVMAGIRIRF
jgi:hypothetical protein